MLRSPGSDIRIPLVEASALVAGSLICLKSVARTALWAIGTSYSLAVRLSIILRDGREGILNCMN